MKKQFGTEIKGKLCEFRKKWVSLGCFVTMILILNKCPCQVFWKVLYLSTKANTYRLKTTT